MNRDEAERVWDDLRRALDEQNAFAEASGETDGPRAGAWVSEEFWKAPGLAAHRAGTVRMVIRDIDCASEVLADGGPGTQYAASEAGPWYDALATLTRAEALALAQSLIAAAQE